MSAKTYVHQVMVRLSDQKSLRQVALQKLRALVEGDPLFKSLGSDLVRPLIRDHEKLARWKARAKRASPDAEWFDLEDWVVVLVPPGQDREALAKRAEAINGVERSFVSLRPEPPSAPIIPDGDPTVPDQGHLRTEGVSARCVWGIAGADGAGIGFADIERGPWALDHPDISGAPDVAGGRVTALGVLPTTGDPTHATRVMGVVMGYDHAPPNDDGYGLGVAPRSGPNWVATYLTPLAGTDPNWWTDSIPDAINDAMDVLPDGGVLLLEVELSETGPPGTKYPAEYSPILFGAIKNAALAQVVVVEPSGNGMLDLDPLGIGANDSLAIMVGAGISTTHARRMNSNHGSRVDCWAWGDSVATADSTSGIATWYTGFSDTSAAAAIVAGVALSVQGMRKHHFGVPYSPTALRNVLRTHGKPSTTPSSGINVMPDLRMIAVDELGLLPPDVYVRDKLGDDGSVPSAGAVSSSPDIIIAAAPYVDAEAALGIGSGLENSVVGGPIVGGVPHTLYVRLWNRGSGDETAVRVRLYWSPPATLVLPSLWTEITNPASPLMVPLVPQGAGCVISPPIPWGLTSIPGPGHYCFVAVVGSPCDPAPNTSAVTDWPGYMALVRDQNNVAWRNFNVVPVEMEERSSSFELPFFMMGAPDRARRMEVEVQARLPRGARIEAEVPALMKRNSIGLTRHLETDRKNVRVRLPNGRASLGEAVFPPGYRGAARLRVALPKIDPRGRYTIVVIQRFEKAEVGRITWQFEAKRRRLP